MNLNEWGPIGYTLEVDLEYTEEAKSKSWDLPFAPEKIEIHSSELSEYMHDLYHKAYNTDKNPPNITRKLLMTHRNKTNYVVHLALLKFYVQQGMRVTKIHRIVQYKQTKLFADYIKINSEKRQVALNDFEKDYFKLKNNCIYGKSVQNPFKKIKFRLTANVEKAMDYAARPDLTRLHVYGNGLYGIHLKKTTVVQDKPSFVGQTVLDISKLIMYKFRYETLEHYKHLLNGNLYLSAGDTDSFFINLQGISADSFLNQLAADDLLDASNYPSTHPRYSKKNKAKLGCWKDEAAGRKFKAWYFYVQNATS